jgi:hypothetical protein
MLVAEVRKVFSIWLAAIAATLLLGAFVVLAFWVDQRREQRKSPTVRPEERPKSPTVRAEERPKAA